MKDREFAKRSWKNVETDELQKAHSSQPSLPVYRATRYKARTGSSPIARYGFFLQAFEYHGRFYAGV